MSDLVDPDTWEANRAPDDANTPSFRFSRYFTETSERVTPKVTGAWLKTLDLDTIKDFCETFRDIDAAGQDDKIDSDDETRKDMADLLYLVVLLWQWETGKAWDINLADSEAHHLQVEYLFRLARLVQFELLQKMKITSADDTLERDDAQHHGKLTIYG